MEIILLLCTSECSLATVKLAVSAYTVSLLSSPFPLVVLLITMKKKKLKTSVKTYLRGAGLEPAAAWE